MVDLVHFGSPSSLSRSVWSHTDGAVHCQGVGDGGLGTLRQIHDAVNTVRYDWMLRQLMEIPIVIRFCMRLYDIVKYNEHPVALLQSVTSNTIFQPKSPYRGVLQKGPFLCL